MWIVFAIRMYQLWDDDDDNDDDDDCPQVNATESH